MSNKTKIDKTADLQDWLDANAKIVAEPADLATWKNKETIYTAPLSKKDDFEKVFWRAFCDWDSLSEYGGPGEDAVWVVVNGKYESTKGPYKWRKCGYDFDGFYEAGGSGSVECDCYYAFREARVYQYRDFMTGQTRTTIDVDKYADGTPTMLYVVCFVEDADGR